MKHSGERTSINVGQGFQDPSPGLHSFEVDDQPEAPGYVTQGEGENAEVTDTVRVWSKVIDDDEEEGRRIPTNFKLDKKGGRTAFCLFLYYTKVIPILEKKFDKIKADLDEVEWGEKYLDPATKAGKQIVRTALSQLVGRSFDSVVELRENVKVKNRETGKIELRDFSNLGEMGFYGKGTSKKDDDDDKGSKKSKAKSKAKEEEEPDDEGGGDEDWPE